MLDRHLFRDVDWLLAMLLILNSIIGVVFIYSSSHYLAGNFYTRQVIWVFVGLAAFFLTLAVDYKFLLSYSLYLYIALMAALVAVLIIGSTVAGSRSWIRLGFFQAQPSELMKVAVILVLARLFSDYKAGYLTWNMTLLSLVLVLFPVGLIILQPDLGTALTFLPILLAAFYLAGLRKKTIFVFLAAFLCLGALAWNFGLKEYQKNRLTTLIYPSQDPRGAGYHILQSKIAIGSGGIIGKGFKKGSQSQLKFLPARHTDFVFSVIGEEFGFLGVFFVMACYFLLFSRLFDSLMQSRDRAGIYIVFMASILIAFQFFVNVLMIIGLFPITGIPLPFMSYGGSSLLSNFIVCGLVVNVRMRRFANV